MIATPEASCHRTVGRILSLRRDTEAPEQRISPITGEELQVKFLPNSEENTLKY
jgi:hypothetical protein